MFSTNGADMELYAKPIINTTDDGSVHIDVKTITPEYVDTRLAELAVFKQIKYNSEEVVSVLYNFSSKEEARKRMKATLGVGPAEADFLLELTIEELVYYFDKDNCEAEIKRWKALKALLVAQ